MSNIIGASQTTNVASPSPASHISSRPSGTREWGFVETLRTALDQAEQLQTVADAKVQTMLSGDGMDVHSAMIAVEKSDLSFQLMMQVRNKIVAAYQEISRMQF
jgi:flagellar hook-basal body complex protein FliE